ncbi:HAD-IA family hydrolase [Alteraurantiacibacter aquimixticola]|uniref:HAD family hydrolase n=1 Tax=Alteraurantiacibacter aquimixticola TaxID=2489173 RepID=A0A4T3F2F9_9SPHN|nr:HAD-IA family hydrolase [Alteraurantiacibacter aquimixticola]TIX51298.1 HAD family hydrolase [Alteraurantiacibacter aquimixticola]
MSIRLAIFDCDGTLSDGQAAVCRSMETAFAAVDLPAPNPGAVRRIVGLSLPNAIRQLAPDAREAQHMEAVAAYKQAFFAMRQDGSLREPLYPGMEELVRNLHARGWALGVATGKSDRGLKATLMANGLLDIFTTLQTADRHPSKPHPSMLLTAMEDTFAPPAQTVMVGDTVFDMEAAKAANVDAIGVGWGYHEADELLAAGARAVAQTAAELEELIDGA